MFLLCAAIIDLSEFDFSEEESDGLAVPNRHNRRVCNEEALQLSLGSGRYPEFLGIEGPQNPMDPRVNSALDYLRLLWPEFLSDLIVVETNRYGGCKAMWVDVDREELLSFFGLITMMGIKRLPRLENYWSKDFNFCCNSPLRKVMSRTRFWQLWSNLHVVDNAQITSRGLTSKIKPVLDVLERTFFLNYCPGQELSVDEAMIKYKGHARGKVRMPKKPVKIGFKVWCCCCSCCGYLCTFQVYEGRPVDPGSGKSVTEKGMVSRVVKDLTLPFSGSNHVLYMDNFFNSGPLVEELAEDKIFVAGTIKERAVGFPDSLKGLKLSKGDYASERVGDTCYYAFEDRKRVCLVSNVFPERMDSDVVRVQIDGSLQLQAIPPVLPAYNKYMGGVDRLSQVRKSYGFDRKSRRYWVRAFFQFFDYAINNAYLLYKHNCRLHDMTPRDLLDFRIDLMKLLIRPGKHRYRTVVPRSPSSGGSASCSLCRVGEVGLRRGKCRHCMDAGINPPHHTTFACSYCKVCLCKIPCFADFHKN